MNKNMEIIQNESNMNEDELLSFLASPKFDGLSFI